MAPLSSSEVQHFRGRSRLPGLTHGMCCPIMQANGSPKRLASAAHGRRLLLLSMPVQRCSPRGRSTTAHSGGLLRRLELSVGFEAASRADMEDRGIPEHSHGKLDAINPSGDAGRTAISNGPS